MKRFPVVLFCSMVLCACHHVYYAPNTPNVPMFSDKGETRINAMYSSGSDSEFGGGELQVSHAVTKAIGVMLNFFAAGKSEQVENYSGSSTTTEIEKGNGSYIEVGGGYFKPLDVKRKWVFETYGGLGFGSVTNEYEGSDFSKVGITKIFLQPSISYKSSNFEVGFVPRLSLINWKVKEERIGTANDDAKNEVNNVKADPSFFAFEPAILLRGGGDRFKVHLALSFSRYNAYNVLYSDEITESLNASVGISIGLLPGKK